MSSLDIIWRGAVVELRLNNPKKLNALTLEMLHSLDQYCDLIEANDECRAVIICAEPAKAFCAGADINEWGQLSPEKFARDWVRLGHRIFDRLARLSKPTIAVISGNAFGGGLELISACDIRVSLPAIKLGLPETSVGVVAGWSGSQRLARLLSESVLKEMMLFGRNITAERAHELGFIAEISSSPLDLAQQIIDQMIGNSSLATEISKYMIHGSVGEDRCAMIEALGSGMISGTNDNREGVLAFKEKRKPNFMGKSE